jgi:outer membrane protein assembly factor BamE (lipoprotein component of BamABCDE complex)
MKRMAIVLLILLLMGCVYGGQFKWDDARKIRQGMTIAEVTQILGDPISVTALADFDQYTWASMNSMDRTARTISLKFTKDGRVMNSPQIPDYYKDDMPGHRSVVAQ